MKTCEIRLVHPFPNLNAMSNHLTLSSLRFAVFSSEDVRRLSVSKIVTPLLFDPLGHALPGGLYDPVMGMCWYGNVGWSLSSVVVYQICIPGPYSTKSDPCGTCGERYNCPGHSGHIELCALLYNPVLIKTIYNILRFACLGCFKLQIQGNIHSFESIYNH